METPALMEAQTVPTSARYIDKLTTVGTCSASMENEATRTQWSVLSLPLSFFPFSSLSVPQSFVIPWHTRRLSWGLERGM